MRKAREFPRREQIPRRVPNWRPLFDLDKKYWKHWLTVMRFSEINIHVELNRRGTISRTRLQLISPTLAEGCDGKPKYNVDCEFWVTAAKI